MFAKTLLSLAVAGAFSLSAAAATQTIDHDITSQDQINALNLDDPTGEISLKFDAGKGFKFGTTEGSDGHKIYRITGNTKKLTIEGDSTLISMTGKSRNVWLTEVSDLTLSTTSGNAIKVDGLEGGMVIGGTQNLEVDGVPYVEGDTKLKKVTIHAENDSAVYVKGSSFQTVGHGTQLPVVILSNDTAISTNSAEHAAVRLTGEDVEAGDADKWRANSALKILGTGTADDKYKGTFTIQAPKKGVGVEADKDSGMEIHVGTLDIQGAVKLDDGAWMDMGWKKASDFPDGWMEDNDRMEESFITKRVSVSSESATQATLHVSQGSLLTMASEHMFITQGHKDGKAIYVDMSDSDTALSPESREKLPTVLYLYGKKTLHVNGDIVIDRTAEGSNSLIRLESEKQLKIKGDIIIKNGEKTQNALQFTLKGAESSFEGSINDQYVTDSAENAPVLLSLKAAGEEEDKTPAKLEGVGTQVVLEDGATMTITGESTISGVKSDGGVLAIEDKSLTLKSLKNSGDTTIRTASVAKGQINVEKVENAADGILKVRVANAEGLQKAEDLRNIVNFGAGQSQKFDAGVEEGAGSTEHGFVFDDEGNVVSAYADANTSVSESAADIAGLQVLAWRAQMNDVNKRLGDLRLYPAAAGGWARVYGGEEKYGDRSLKNTHATVQVGADTRVRDDFYVGATVSYTKGDGKMANGTSDDESWAFGIYGGWTGDDGSFLDVIVKEANMESTFDLAYRNGQRSTGKFDLWGTSVSVQYGRRFADLPGGFWLEPDAEFAFGRMQSADYRTSDGVKVEQDAVNTVITRLGLSAGRTFERGSAYVKASVAHDFDGEATIKAGNGLKAISEDLGGTWVEAALGGTYRLSDAWYAYGEVETVFGSPVKSPYRWNVGARFCW